LSRFVVLDVPEYTHEEFVNISVSRLGKEKINMYTAAYIAKKVWHEIGSKDIRDVIKIVRLVTNQEDVPRIISIMQRYSMVNDNTLRSNWYRLVLINFGPSTRF